MKHSILKASILVVAMLSIAMAQAKFEVNGVYYNANSSNKTASVTTGDALYSGTVTIPATVTYEDVTYNVTSIEANAFANCIELTAVNIGSNVTTIGSRAFYGCKELKSIIIPDATKTFGVMSTNSTNSNYNKSEVFVGCNALESATIGANVTSMGSGLFMNCTALKSVTIKEGCTVIGPSCFKGCTSITSQTIPNSVKNIANEAFSGCTSLTSISIPNSVTTIGYLAFNGCTAMTQATVGDGVTILGNRAFYGCIHLQNVTLGNNLRTIEYRAFYNCEELESIVIPDSVTTFSVVSTNSTNSDYNKSEVFVGCTSLESVTIGKKVANMGKSLFLNCTALKNVTIKDGCSYIGPTCFMGCTKIANITIPNSVEKIDYEAFSGCTALTGISIPNSVTTIGYLAFNGCTAMIQATVGDGVTTLGNRAFYGCIHLQNVSLGSGLRTIEHRVFYNCEELESIVIPDSVTTFGVVSTNSTNSDYNKSEVFVGCKALTSATLGKKVTNMGSGLFMNCTALKNVTIKEGCTYIGPSCFKGCKKIASVTIPSSMVNIANEAFSGCTALNGINIPDDVLTIGNDAFYGCTSMTQATVGDGVTTIGNNAFYGCTAMTSLHLGSGLLTINSRAFYECKALTEVVLPDNVKTLGVVSTNSTNSNYNKSETFVNCTSLKSVTLGKNLTSVGTLVFNGCNNLLTVTARMAEPIKVNANVFPNRAKETLCVFPESKELYAAADVWKEFGQITEIGQEKAEQTLSLTSLPTMTAGDTYTLPSTTTQGLTLTWTSSNTQVATISGNVLTAKAAGNATITASQAGNDSYQSFQRQFSLTVKEKEEPQTDEASLQIASITARGGQKVALPILLTSGEYTGNIVGVSFTLALPEGVSVATDEYDEPLYSFASDRVNQRQFGVTAAQVADGSWGFRVYTTAAAGAIMGTKGVFMTVTLNVADRMADGTYTINMTGNKLSVREANNKVNSVVIGNASATLTIENYLPGDVNGDGEVDLSDAIMVTYYSLGVEPAGFIRVAADMNDDGEIDLTDAIIIIYKSLGVIPSRSMTEQPIANSDNDFMQLQFDGTTSSLLLTNEASYLGLQCDVLLPEGATLTDVRLNSSRSDGHTVMFNDLGNGRYRVVAYSLGGNSFFGNMGELLAFITEGMQGGSVQVQNIFLVGSDLQKHPFATLSAQATDCTEISVSQSAPVVYDLQGRQSTSKKNGIYLQLGKKYIVK